MLKDYELEFRLYLSIKKSPGKEVPIGVWEVPTADEKRLDIYEGYPRFYRKEYIPIEVDGKKVDALVYIMNDVRLIEPPTSIYMQTCVQGYKDFGFDVKYLKEALNNCTKA